MWRERLTFRKDRAILEVPRLRSNALCGALLPPEALPCRFFLRPSKRLAAGNHTIAIRQFEAGVQLGGVTWMLRPVKKKGKGWTGGAARAPSEPCIPTPARHDSSRRALGGRGRPRRSTTRGTVPSRPRCTA